MPDALRSLAGAPSRFSDRAKKPPCWGVERFFNNARQFRRIATRYDKPAENYLAALKLVAIRVWRCGNKSRLGRRDDVQDHEADEDVFQGTAPHRRQMVRLSAMTVSVG